MSGNANTMPENAALSTGVHITMPEVYQKPLKYGYLHINDTAVILMLSALDGLYCIYKAITLASFSSNGHQLSFMPLL